MNWVCVLKIEVFEMLQSIQKSQIRWELFHLVSEIIVIIVVCFDTVHTEFYFNFVHVNPLSQNCFSMLLLHKHFIWKQFYPKPLLLIQSPMINFITNFGYRCPEIFTTKFLGSTFIIIKGTKINIWDALKQSPSWIYVFMISRVSFYKIHIKHLLIIFLI